MIVEVKTAHGTYKVKKPVGRLGAVHMSLLMKMELPEGSPDDWDDEQRKEILRSSADIFREWAEKVLPHIVMDGPFRYDEMPGEDQYVVFLHLIQDIKLPEEFFQSPR